MEAPCEFVRDPSNHKPLSYTFGKKNEIRVVIVSGGPPDSEVKDPLQPEGCGTVVRSIVIKSDKIEIREKRTGNGPICPSLGLEEPWYAS